jgi:CO/xanthine dehydrogenase Mo-binding subunit
MTNHIASQMSLQSPGRRDFLKLMGVAGGGLIVGASLTGCGTELPGASEQGALVANAFIQILPSGQVQVYIPANEMGQGVWTGLTTLVAEELKTPPEQIRVKHAGVHPDYTNPLLKIQATGGSTAIAGFYAPLRQAAANVRETLRLAAARQLKTGLDDIRLAEGKVQALGRDYSFGLFTGTAAQLPPVESAPLTANEDFQYIGKVDQRLDAIAKCTGTAAFGIDVEVPEMRKAVVKRCPVNGGKLKSHNGGTVESLPGVDAVVVLEHGIAVIAESYWQAKKAAESLQITWDLPELAQQSTEQILGAMHSALAKLESGEGDADEVESRGDIGGLAAAEHQLSAQYSFPYLAHATMEPMNCAVRIEHDRCDVWVGAQSNQLVRDCAARYSGLDRDNVHVHDCFLGGGFGRRSHLDFVAEAVQVARHSGLAVQVIWSREDDMRHDYFRPASVASIRAGFDGNGKISHWRARRAGGNILPYMMDDVVDVVTTGVLPLSVANWLSKRGYGVFDGWAADPSSVEGLFEDYDFPNLQVEHCTVDAGVRLGFWRSVGFSANTFAKEVFMDEIASQLAIDPVELRLRNLADNPRMAHVVRTAAKRAGWGEPTEPGRFQGFAAQQSFGSLVAQVVELSVDNGNIVLHKVVCAVDCGVAVNPDIVRAQMESGIIFGATAALYGRVDFQKGSAQQSNFHDYRLLRMNETPAMDIHIIESAEAPTGVGEPGVPPIAPAIATALYAATGVRYRSLPLQEWIAT